jgi:hypothetical protein
MEGRESGAVAARTSGPAAIAVPASVRRASRRVTVGEDIGTGGIVWQVLVSRKHGNEWKEE